MLYVKRNPMLRAKIVDGTILAAAVVLNSIPKKAGSVIVVGKLSKVALSLCLALSKKGVKVCTFIFLRLISFFFSSIKCFQC